MIWLVTLALVVLFTPLVLAIPILWLTQRFRGEPRLVRLALADVAGLDRAYFDHMTAAFEHLGFRSIGEFEFVLLASPRIFVRLMLSGDGRIVAGIYEAAAGHASEAFLELFTQWPAGQSLTTANYRRKNVFRLREERCVLWLPRVHDPADLLRRHELGMRMFGDPASAIPHQPRDVPDRIVRQAERDLQDQVRYRRLRRTRDGGYRFTLYGAAVGALQQWWYTFFGRWLPRG